MVVMVDMQFRGIRPCQLIPQAPMLRRRLRRCVIILCWLVEQELFTQLLNLIIGVHQHLTQLGYAELQVGVVLQQVAHEVRDHRAPILAVAQCLHGCGPL